MHGLIFETSIWLLAGSTRFRSNINILDMWHARAGCKCKSKQAHSWSECSFCRRTTTLRKCSSCILLPTRPCAANNLACMKIGTPSTNTCVFKPHTQGCALHQHLTPWLVDSLLQWGVSPYDINWHSNSQSAMSAPTNASTCISWHWKQLSATMVRQLHASPSKFCVAQMCAFSPPLFQTLKAWSVVLGAQKYYWCPLVIALLRANLTDIIFCGCPAKHRSNSALMFVMRMTSQLNFPQPLSVYKDSCTAWLPGHMVAQVIGRHCRHKQISRNTSDRPVCQKKSGKTNQTKKHKVLLEQPRKT